MNIDWSKAPEGATHGRKTHTGFDWYKVINGNFCYLSRAGQWETAVTPMAMCVIRPIAKEWTDEGLPPLESTVRIVTGGVAVWKEAERFIGADCTLKAVFVTGEQRMVALEHQEDLVCCCFRAEMVRTPEQAKAEEREDKAKALYYSVFFNEQRGRWEQTTEQMRDNFRSAVDAGWQQVKP